MNNISNISNRDLVIITIIVMVICGILYKNKKEYFDFITAPEMNDGDKFMLVTLDGQYLSVCKKCSPYNANINNLCSSLLCLSKYPVQNSVFTYHSFLDGRFAIETNEFKFWKHCDNCIHDCKGAVCADGINKNLPTHKWILIKNGDSDNSISIKSNTGRMIQRCDCSQTCGSIMCTMGLQGNEKFKVEKVLDVPPPPIDFIYKIKRGRSSLSDGVSLSMVV